MSYHLSVSGLFFEYDSAVEPLFSNLDIHFPPGFTGVVGANGSGKTTLLKLLSGRLKPERGNIAASGEAVLCEQEVFFPPADMEAFFEAGDRYAFRLRMNLGLALDMLERWETLSLGERKKIQIGTALWRQADILCLDEPTNHLDAASRSMLIGELRTFRGIGVLVSHDRKLLDELCGQCLFLAPGVHVLRPGGITEGLAQQEAELERRLDLQQNLKKELRRKKAELQRRREKEQKSRNADSKRKLDRHDHDGKGRIDAARISGSDRTASDLAKLQAKNVERTEMELSLLGKVRREQYGLKIPYGTYAEKNTLLEIPGQTIHLSPDRRLAVPDLRIEKHDRIALTGSNGSGKTTLLEHILPEIKLDAAHVLYMPQELDDTMTGEISSMLKSLRRTEYSQVMNVVASLGSRPERLLNPGQYSPGEWRKLFFGLGVLRDINLIIMDEPTNHLDLPSLLCLEDALASCDCALFLISHDRLFLEKTCKRHWQIENGLLRKGFFPD